MTVVQSDLGRALTVGGICLALLLLPPQGALAAFPGENGRIAFQRSQILTIKPDGSKLRVLTHKSDFPRRDRYAFGPVYSADGRRIVFATGDCRIYTMRADGSHLARVPNGDGYAPAFAPNGKRIVFSNDCDSSPATDIFTMRLNGTHLRQLTDNPFRDVTPEYSPSGKRIAFASNRTGRYPQGPHYEIFTMRTDGTHVRQLTESQGNSSPSYSPDGRRIAFVSRRGDGLDISLVRTDGSHEHRVTDGPRDDQDPAFSPDGRRIAFVRSLASGLHIFTMRTDGSHKRQLTHTDSTYSSTINIGPDWQPRLR